MKKYINGIKLNNKGVSLIEIIIVLAIMGVIGGIVVLSTSVATDKQVNSCAERICSSIEQTRSLALGKKSGSVNFWKPAGDSVMCQMVIDGSDYGDQVAIGHAGLSVNVLYCSAYTDDSNNTVEDSAVLGPTHTLLVFSRTNGSVTNAPSGTSYIVFQVSNGRRQTNVIVDTFTGRVTTEKVS